MYGIDIYLIMTIKSSQTLVSEALKEIKTISTDEAHEMSNNNQCNLIDIRDIRELEKEGGVGNANHIPRGMLEFWLDPDSIYFKKGKLDLNKEMVLFCAGGIKICISSKIIKRYGF